MSILNCARSGKLLPDRSIREYCRDIWHAEPSNSQMLCTAGLSGGDGLAWGHFLRLLSHSICKFHALNDLGDSFGTA